MVSSARVCPLLGTPLEQPADRFFAESLARCDDRALGERFVCSVRQHEVELGRDLVDRPVPHHRHSQHQPEHLLRR